MPVSPKNDVHCSSISNEHTLLNPEKQSSRSYQLNTCHYCDDAFCNKECDAPRLQKSCNLSAKDGYNQYYLRMGYFIFSIFGFAYFFSSTSTSVIKIMPSEKTMSLMNENSIIPKKSTLPRPLIYLDHLQSYQLLLDGDSTLQSFSSYSSDYFLLSTGFDAQINQAYCGVATVATVLNSFRFLIGNKGKTKEPVLDIPVDTIYAPYKYATQKDVFNDCSKKEVISHVGGGFGVDDILSPPFGLSMDQISKLLSCQLNSKENHSGEWTIDTYYVDKTESTVTEMIFDMKNALADPNSRVLVNFHRSQLGQDGGGHWSPLGSYSDIKNAFLILDVAKYKYPPYWAPSERLFDAMATYDSCGHKSDERLGHTEELYKNVTTKLNCESRPRGYIILSTKRTR